TDSAAGRCPPERLYRRCAGTESRRYCRKVRRGGQRMYRISGMRAACGLMLAAGALVFAQAQKSTPAQSIAGNFNSINRRLLEMAKDFPEEKYDYRPSKEVRSFGEVMVHIMAGNTYAAKVGRGEKADWEAEEANPKAFKGKAEIVAAFQKSVDDATAS